MRIKKFKNIWTMGLIIFGVILVAFYILKLVNPSFIIGIAEMDAIVSFGQYIDTHEWAYLLYNFIYGYIGGYFLFCACCRQYKLTLKQNIILASEVALLLAISKLIPQQYSAINYLLFIFTPYLMCLVEGKVNKDTFASTAICFSVDIFSQVASATIRNLVISTTWFNTATLTILLIDGLIWRILLYMFYNYKRSLKNEED